MAYIQNFDWNKLGDLSDHWVLIEIDLSEAGFVGRGDLLHKLRQLLTSEKLLSA